jgi:hypothetical protein
MAWRNSIILFNVWIQVILITPQRPTRASKARQQQKHTENLPQKKTVKLMFYGIYQPAYNTDADKSDQQEENIIFGR